MESIIITNVSWKIYNKTQMKKFPDDKDVLYYIHISYFGLERLKWIEAIDRRSLKNLYEFEINLDLDLCKLY